jgi:UDP-N-acetylglucosamine 3-dehydrogenase
MTHLRAVLFGLGQMGRHHARALSALEGVDLVGVHDPRFADADPADLGVPLIATTDEVFALEPDIAIVATPTSTHVDLGFRLAEAGVHVLLEKPVAATSAEAQKLVEAFTGTDLVAAVGHIERFNPALQQMRRRLDDGQLGEIYQVATRRTGPFPSRIADVGVCMDLATHDIDLTSWVTRSTYQSVTAHTANRSGREHEDLVSAVAVLEEGIVANHLVNWLSPLKERITVVTGERGSLVADTVAMDLTFYANGVAPVEWETLRSFKGVVQGDVIRYAIPKPEPLLVELAGFRDAVLNRGSKYVGLADASRVVAVAEAMVRSSLSGRTEYLVDTAEGASASQR